MDVWRSLKLVRERSGLFLASCLIAFIVVLFGPLLIGAADPIYSSSAKILLAGKNSGGEQNPDREPSAVRAWFSDESTLRALITSEPLLKRVVESANLKKKWSALRPSIKIRILSHNPNQVSLIEVSVEGETPQASEKLTNTLAKEFVEYVMELSAKEFTSTRVYLEELVEKAKKQMEEAEAAMLKTRVVPRSAEQRDPQIEAMMRLRERRTELTQEEARLKGELDDLQLARYTPWAIVEQKDGTLSKLEDNLSNERFQLVSLRQVYTDSNENVKAQIERVRQAEALYNQEVERKVNALSVSTQRKYEQARQALATTTQELRKLEEAQPTSKEYLEYSQRERQLQMWHENYLSLTRQLYQARVAEQSSRRQGAITILEQAQVGVPLRAPGPGSSTLTRALIAIPLSLLFALGVVLMSDYLMASMRMQPRIEEALGLPVIGAIPVLPEDLTRNWDRMKNSLKNGTTRNGSAPLDTLSTKTEA
jgi:capsular polysaccharide biosynthesis protein